MSTLPLPYINRCTQCVSVLRIRINLTQVQMEPDPAFRKIKKSNQLFKNGKTFLKASLQVQMFPEIQKKNSDKGPIKFFRSGNRGPLSSLQYIIYIPDELPLTLHLGIQENFINLCHLALVVYSVH